MSWLLEALGGMVLGVAGVLLLVSLAQWASRWLLRRARGK